MMKTCLASRARCGYSASAFLHLRRCRHVALQRRRYGCDIKSENSGYLTDPCYPS